MVYLPTFTIKLSTKCRYTYHIDPMGVGIFDGVFVDLIPVTMLFFWGGGVVNIMTPGFFEKQPHLRRFRISQCSHSFHPHPLT